MQLTMGEVASILGSSSECPERIVRGYSLDSRTIAHDQLFFALRGPRFDGHQFVAQALERGAVGAVVEVPFHQQAEATIAAALLPVGNTLAALQHLGEAVRRRWGGRLVAVTGSTGKSTTKEMIAALLGRRWNVLKSPGNLNNHYGLPLALLGLEPQHDVAVVELAMSAAGEIAHLAEISEPQIGVVTNVAPVHLQFFDSVDAIALAKGELVDYLASRSEPTVAVLNHDDLRVRAFAEGFKGRVVTFGLEEGADFRAMELRPGESTGSAFRVVAPAWEQDFKLPLPGRHNVQNALAALAVADQLGVPKAELGKALAAFQNLHQRGEILTLPGKITVLNDSYNSNPLAMERMLEVLAAWPGARRRVVVAGEMLELGRTSPDLHREIGRRCAHAHVAWLVAVQGDARFFLEGALEAGFPPERARFFADAGAAAEFCRAIIEPGDVILVKGSRVVRLERVIELLLEVFQTDSPVSPRTERGSAD
jgi:UDP-N-acetylmuramoyl-tripeptide--D-alanyl-D-alanine ligase